MAKMKNVCALAAMVCACEAWADWNGRMIVTNDVEEGQYIGDTSSGTVIWQTNYTVKITGGGYFSRPSLGWAAYLLDGGSLTFGERWAYGAYAHFRQRGGDFRASGTFYNGTGGIRKDFVFGGNGMATFVSPLRLNAGSSAAFVFCDNVEAAFKGNDWYLQVYRNNDGSDPAHAIWVYNGGRVSHCFYGYGHDNSPRGHFFAFNGGTRGTLNSSTASCVFGTDPRVCVYERGGCLMSVSGSIAMNLGDGFPNLGGPDGNVIKSVILTEAARTNNGNGWDYPPSVEIIDTTGSNAVAVVDYDYENRAITNITVLCGGEAYSDSPVANFRYKAGDALLDSPLTCTVGETYAGDFTFAMTNKWCHLYAYNTTNYCRGNLTLDLDMSEVLDFKGSASGLTGDNLIYGNGLLVYAQTRKPYFPNITNIVLKSGLMDSTEGSAAYSASVFPSLQRLELYKGHVGAANIQTLADVVIGGRIFLAGHHLTGRYATLGIPDNGTLWVDYGATKTNGVPVTPSFSYGTFNFGTGAKIAIKNWDSIPRGRRTLVLDMSGADAPISVSGTPTIVPSSEGTLVWEGNRLYARRHSDGMFLIFK